MRATRPTTRRSAGAAGGERAARPDHEDPRRALGRLGEQLAAAHLHRLGFATLARNVRSRHGEIDLIVFDGRTLAFVEVKTRLARSAGQPLGLAEQPLARLRPRQRARIRRLARAWLSDSSNMRPTAGTIRFDAIGVIVDRRGQLVALEHVEGAW
ncbi:MAG TPA: YraN family protein [Solirubrobacteraceae bacterium]|nr:YraN family protein [Solirubrobacteraceae bacterium]